MTQPRAKLRALVDATGLPKRKVAAACGVTRQHLYNLMGGACAPGIGTARRVAAYLGHEIEVLFP